MATKTLRQALVEDLKKVKHGLDMLECFDEDTRGGGDMMSIPADCVCGKAIRKQVRSVVPLLNDECFEWSEAIALGKVLLASANVIYYG